MIAHLSIPSIDNTPNKPTSISYKNVTELMRNELGYQGLTFTDALGTRKSNAIEMKTGVDNNGSEADNTTIIVERLPLGTVFNVGSN